jgi:chromosome segregation ATPase
VSEFAFEIGSGLLTEVRRLQSLLAERDKAIQDSKEEKDDLETSLESLRTALRSQEQSAGEKIFPPSSFLICINYCWL